MRSHLLLAVGGGPAAQKAVSLMRRLQEHDIDVKVVLGPEAERWVPWRTFAVTGAVRASEQDEAPQGVVAIAASEDALADLAMGGGWLGPWVADPTTLLVLEPEGSEQGRRAWMKGPRRALKARGVQFLVFPTEAGDLVQSVLRRIVGRDLEGVSILITAGPTREYLDPVRFLSNPSTGRMGIALATAAGHRGARVELCLGPTTLVPPRGVVVHRFETAEELDDLVQALGPEVDLVIAAAAVADWRPAERAKQKIKKVGDTQTVSFVRTPDVLARLSRSLEGRAQRPTLVGFAAETSDLEVNARRKLERKALDLVVANRVDGPSGAFASEEAEVTLVDARGSETLPRRPKSLVATAILDRIVSLLEVSNAPVP